MASKTRTVDSQELYAPTRELLSSLVDWNPNDVANALLGNEANRNPQLPAQADPRAALDTINPSPAETAKDYENQVAIAALTEGLAQSQAFHAKPTRVAVQPPSIAAANRVNTGARLRGSNTIATIDSNGRAVITGGKGIVTGYETGYEQDPNYGKVVGVLAPSSPLSTPSTSDTIASMMADVAKESDIDIKVSRLFQVKSAYESRIASMKADAYKAAELEIGVPALKTSLEAAMTRDRNDPLWDRFQTDSTPTAAARAQYQSALTAATTLADKHFLANPEVGKLKGLVEPFLEMQQRNLTKQSGRQEAVTEMTDMLGDNPKRLAEASFVGTQDPAATAAKNMNNKEFYEAAVTMQSPERLVPLALRTDNMFAGKALALKQADTLSGGKTKNPALFDKKFLEAEKDINAVKELIYNDSQLATKYKEAFGKDLVFPPTDPLGDKKEVAALKQAMKEEKALETIKEIKKQRFENNISTWDNFHRFTDPDSLGAKLYQKAVEGVGTASAISLPILASSIAKFPPEQRPAMEMELKKIVREGLATSAGGVFANWGSSADADTLVAGYIRSSISANPKTGGNLLGFLNKINTEVLAPTQREVAALAAYPEAISNSIMTSGSPSEVLLRARARSLGSADWLLGKENK